MKKFQSWVVCIILLQKEGANMTISQKIVQSLRTDSQVSEEDDGDIFDLDERLRSSAEKVLHERINFVPAKYPHSFDLSQLKSKYIILNPKKEESSCNSSPMISAGIKDSSSMKSMHDGIPTPKTILCSAEAIELSWKKAMRAGAGLYNLGNTCFLNSSLQCLAYTAPLANYLNHTDHRKHCRSAGQFCMLCAMHQHLHNVHSNAGQPIKPMHILKNLRMIAKHLQFGRQEDAHEFIRYSVDAMQKACLFGQPSKLDVHIKATTAVHQIFGGYLRSRVKCMQCKSVSDTFDPFLDLSLDINKQGCGNLHRCMEVFVRAEILQGDNAYKCMRCKNTVTAYKKFSIHRCPNILMLQLKRFSNFMGNKIHKDLSYPSKLNLAPYMSSKPASGLWYELYAVLVHSGFSCNSGHYYAYAKAPNGQWYCFNDSSVYQVSVNQVLNQQAYLLFYSRNPKMSAHIESMKNGHSVTMNGKNGLSETVASKVTKQTKESNSFHKPIIGPQLPPGYKKEKDKVARVTSSNSIPSSSNQTKSTSSTSCMKPSNGVNGNVKPLSFSLNRKPKLISDEKVFSNGNKSQSFSGKGSAVKPSTIKKLASSIGEKVSRTSGTSSVNRPPIFDQLLKDSEKVASTSSASKPQAVSSKSSSALQAIVSYSSGDSDSEEDNSHKPVKPGYSTLTSTLEKLRSENKSSSPSKKISVKETVTPPLDKPSVEKSKRQESSTKITDKNDSLRKTEQKLVNNSNRKRSSVPTTSNGTPAKVKENGMHSNKGNDHDSISKRGTSSEREPILHLLSSEISSSSGLKTDSSAEKGSSAKAESCLRNESNKNGSSADISKNLTKFQQRKRHYSAESTTSNGHSNHKSSKMSMPLMKREKTEKRRHSDDSDSHTSYKKDKYRKNGFGHDRKRNCSPTHYSNGKHSKDGKAYDRDHKIDKFYRDKREYEHTMRKKAKKEKKQRKENLQLLQNCINQEESPQEHKDEPEKGMKCVKKEDTLERSSEKTCTMKGEQKKRSNSLSTKDRPNILGQLLKQSSEKAYGAKVESWNGKESVVENDARNTWTELKAHAVDDWDKEYDKGKVKKVKKESRQKGGHGLNIFQKFQNMKNERNGGSWTTKNS